jgi:hypothetical protein
MTKYLPSELSRIARAQKGVFTRRQALRAGVTRDAVNAKVRHRTWRRLYPGVYTTGLGRLSRETRLWAAVLHAGPGAVLSHETAAELHGLISGESAVIHVTIPADRKIAVVRGIRVHRARRDLDPPEGFRDPPQTTVEETILDLVHAARALKDAFAWVTTAFARDLTSEARLSAELSARTRMPWRAQLLTAITASAAGDNSALEHLFTRKVEHGHGLPEPSRQVPFVTSDGRHCRRDRVFDQFRVIVELDGRMAHPPEITSQDKARDRAAAARGYLTVRYEWLDVYSTSCVTAVEMAQVLAQRGWTGRPRPCGPGCPLARLPVARLQKSHSTHLARNRGGRPGAEYSVVVWWSELAH